MRRAAAGVLVRRGRRLIRRRRVLNVRLIGPGDRRGGVERSRHNT